MAVVVLDAGIVIAVRAADDQHHHAALSVLASYPDSAFVLPASAYAETLVEPTSKGHSALRAAQRVLKDIPVAIEPITSEIAERAAILREHVRLPDALVLATGDVLDADVVLTTDKRWKQISRRVRVVA